MVVDVPKIGPMSAKFLFHGVHQVARQLPGLLGIGRIVIPETCHRTHPSNVATVVRFAGEHNGFNFAIRQTGYGVFNYSGNTSRPEVVVDDGNTQRHGQTSLRPNFFR